MGEVQNKEHRFRQSVGMVRLITKVRTLSLRHLARHNVPIVRESHTRVLLIPMAPGAERWRSVC